MKNNNLFLAIILPTFLGAFGLLYSSYTAGIVMIVFTLLFGMIISSMESIAILVFLILFQPFIISWSVLIVKSNKKLNLIKSQKFNESDLIIGGRALMQTFVVIFITLILVAFISQFKKENILSSNIYVFYIIELIFTILFCLLPEKNNVTTINH